MTETINPVTGEVEDAPSVLELVPLDLVALDEDALLAMFPSPVQVAGALQIARARIGHAPAVLKDLSAAVKSAKRDLLIAKGKAYRDARQAGFNITDARAYAEVDGPVVEAREAVDDAELELEFGRDLRKSLTTDIDILRSLNANFRAEHHS
ncbi:MULTISPECIES: hypothetical protein [unclassified Microbacterium]|uniref:hypothetical protein n=1 Tax=unclassified Microbacterium TaxID=2609290 RepID=UPI00300FC9F6